MDTALVWIVLIITTGIVLVTLFRSNPGPKRVSAEDALKLRYAKGEISEADYFRTLAVLEHDRLLELPE